MLLSKIYTRAGDKGSTALIGGKRVSKSHLRVECYGTLDELNSFIGRLKFLCFNNKKKEIQKIAVTLGEIQNRLSDTGSILATPQGKKWENMPSINQAHIEELEKAIDKMNSALQPLNAFAIPGESEIDSEAHVCRTVCRRAERTLCGAKESGIAIDDFVMAYINRLSDYFFVLSRYSANPPPASSTTPCLKGPVSPPK
ncbi:MAG: cob(I)yrinic acid a,c-diamide adenosyltransferase [Fibromonadaceae bacterium]|jgi:cob(I)alamin adenosyltransferase|nr:cob(I)yrinic acid a,c-diamide adenosyltransferase [Fibromonadaceae bacterium]